MLNHLKMKPVLAASTSVAALALGVAVILPVMNDGGRAPTVVPAPRLSEPTASSAPAAAAPAPEGAGDAPLARLPAPAEPAPPPAAPLAAAEAPPAPITEAPPSLKLAPVDQGYAAARAAPEAEITLEAAPEAGDEMAGAMELAGIDPPDHAAGLQRRLAPASGAPMAAMPKAERAAPPQTRAEIAAETWANAPANPVQITAEAPVSTFSTDVDTASWSILRQTLNAGVMPDADQIRVEEMVNYFPYAYAAPEGDAPFATTVAVMPTPWNPDTRLVTIGLQGALPAIAERPPLNLVLLVDTSGSMEAPQKLGLLKQSLALMLPELRPADQLAIVAYAGSAGIVLPPTEARNRDAILAALDDLTAGGGTAGAEGLTLAYQLAAEMSAPGEVNRVLLATDGDFNLGLSDPEALTDFIAEKRQSGSYLSVLGFGRGNLDDAVMQALAHSGNGTASYIDTLSEARKVLVDQLSGALFPIADDVKVQVEWNPGQVAEYRLIGYETRALAREDFSNDRVDAGEIGAGLQVTAIYEVTAPGSSGLRNDPLRYAAPPEAIPPSDELGFLRLRWKAPGESVSQLIERPITGLEPASDETRFAAAIAGFGQKLRGSAYLGDWGWAEAIDLALSARGADPFGYRIEAITLMRLAQGLDR